MPDRRRERIGKVFLVGPNRRGATGRVNGDRRGIGVGDLQISGSIDRFTIRADQTIGDLTDETMGRMSRVDLN